MSEVCTVLDYIDDIKVPGDVFGTPANEYWGLIYLREGLDFLAQQVGKCEATVRERVNPMGNLNVIAFGTLPEFQGLPMGLLTCAFHWYAISACQYVRTVGVIAKSHDPENCRPVTYVERVIPEVKMFRDKVAAHFAWGSRNKKDNDAERVASIIPSLIWSDDNFVVSGHKVVIRGDDNVTDSEGITPWSVSVVHRRLRDRYWRSIGDSRPRSDDQTSEDR